MSTVAAERRQYETPVHRPISKRRTRILCVSDLGSQSERALLRASRLVRESDAELLVLHLLNNSESEQVVLSGADRARLRSCVHTERAIPAEEQPAAVQIRRGEPQAVISNTALEWNAELIVMAAPQHRAFDRMRGTIAERLLASVNVPVLTVRSEAPEAYSKVAVTTDLLPPALHAARRASDLGFFEHADVAFVHAFHPPYDGIDLGDHRASEQLEIYREKTGRLIEHQLNIDIERAGLKKHRTRVHARMSAEPCEGITTLLADTESELLVLNVAPRSALSRLFNRNIAHRILRDARCDVLAVPESGYLEMREFTKPSRRRA